jgi:hypothetical protein
MTRFLLPSDSRVFVDMGRSLWWEDGSVIYNCCWPLPVQSFSGPSTVRPYFTVSDLRLPFLSPPTIHRAMVKVFNLLKYFISWNMSMALPEVTKWSILLLTISATIASVEQSFCVLKRLWTWLHSTWTHERLTELSLIIVEKKILQNLENRLNFSYSVIDIFTEQYHHMELKCKQ